MNLNERTDELVQAILDDQDALRVEVSTCADACIIDCGVQAPGGYGAGLMMAHVCLADLADVDVLMGDVNGRPCPRVDVCTDHPVAACMASQYAGWQIKTDGFFAMGSGPMRAAAGREDLFDRIGFREKATTVVGTLETSKLPDEAVVRYIAERAGVGPDGITLLVARTASQAGGVQIVARSVETALHKLDELGFDLSRVVSGAGTAPLPPVAADDLAAIGRTNDAVLYGSRVVLSVTGDDDSLANVVDKLPSSASKDHGEPFSAIFERYDRDFYKIDPALFSPAEITLSNIETGRSHHAGRCEPDVLHWSFFG